jgi:L-aminopeptidase/D-esterase-like protein
VKAGIGTAALRLPNGHVVAALLAVNAVGAVFDPRTGEAVAAPRSGAETALPFAMANTTIGVVATTVPLDAGGVHRLAILAHDGLARTIRPAHTQFDGDTLFALCLPVDAVDAQPTNPVLLAEAVAEVVAEAVLRGVKQATALHGVPAATSG